MKKAMIAVLFVQVFISCTENKQTKNTPETVQKKDTMPVSPKPPFSEMVFDSKKDLVCGMPVTAGVSDTAHYKGKVYGFCAPECKDEFVKNPKKYLTVKK